MYIVINELEKDVLREIINIGLARAADSFAEFANDHVLLDVPDVKIIEPSILPEVIEDFEHLYLVTRSDVRGELEGKTYLLFDSENLDRITNVCLREEDRTGGNFDQCKHNMILEISSIITEALVTQLSSLLHLDIESGETETLFNEEERTIEHIKKDLPGGQPFMITIKTQFKNLKQSVELPMLVIFNSQSLFKILSFIRSNNLYDYKVLRS